ncbi:MAG: TetR/AcrR family transcriptional regulator, partial [Planctomycetes bacterium]|nr:TetR/AcrR family transcriptional regulator [Planctomycetota bacterium]
LFEQRGLAAVTTRELAAAAGLGVGTFFNYFPNKEALGMTILADALASGRKQWRHRKTRMDNAPAELFALIWAELRSLGPHRSFAAPVLEACIGPFARLEPGDPAESTRLAHLEAMLEILERQGVEPPGFVAQHLYWTLYLGVLAFWIRDDSPRQEDTRLVLDQSLDLFFVTINPGNVADSQGDPS